jgi:aspartyl-tRNA synthetase
MKRTHHCSELSKSHAGQQATLIGWIDTIRDHGGLVFVDLRDREGITQVVFDPQRAVFKDVGTALKPESVISVEGTVELRPTETANHRLATGAIELVANALQIHNIASVLPFPLDGEQADRVNEDLRLKYRYLDLRRPKKLNLLRLRHKASRAIRDYLDSEAFIEVEMPTLFKSTPEGAREFLVPSRLNPGEFYALTQSPQQYKQMLMVAGLERYYSLARCYRDEDLRADRQPEFTQVDLEMSFIDREDIYALIEGMLKKVWKDTLGIDVQTPFPRMAYADAMNRYGVDKPDTRFDLELKDFSKTFEASEFKVFASVIASGGCVKAFNAKGLADITQGELKALEDIAKTLGAKGLAFIKAEKGEWKSPILKFLSDKEQEALRNHLNIEEGDLVFFAATEWDRACAILGRIRLEAAQLLVKRGRLVIPEDQYNFLWVIEFPLMIFEEEEGRYVSSHHPFTAPVADDIPLLDTNPKAVRGQHYDIVLNGVELGGGSIRIHQPKVQKKIFEDILNIPRDVVESRFGYMLEAFTFGAPPHGGIALGLDRLAAILGGERSIREVIAFPKTQKGQDLMSQAPSPASDKQLRELHIKMLNPEL